MCLHLVKTIENMPGEFDMHVFEVVKVARSTWKVFKELNP